MGLSWFLIIKGYNPPHCGIFIELVCQFKISISSPPNVFNRGKILSGLDIGGIKHFRRIKLFYVFQTSFFKISFIGFSIINKHSLIFISHVLFLFYCFIVALPHNHVLQYHEVSLLHQLGFVVHVHCHLVPVQTSLIPVAQQYLLAGSQPGWH